MNSLGAKIMEFLGFVMYHARTILILRFVLRHLLDVATRLYIFV